MTLTTRSETVIVLQQPDQRFIANKKDKKYELQFKVYKEGEYQLWQDDDSKIDKDPFICRTHTDTLASGRSINLSVTLDAGCYDIVPKIVKSTAVNKELDVEGQSEMDKKNLFSFEEKKQLESIKLAKSGLEIDTVETTYEITEDGEEVENQREWDMVIGLRVYAKDKNVQVTGDEGDYPLEYVSDDDEDPEVSKLLFFFFFFTVLSSFKRKFSNYADIRIQRLRNWMMVKTRGVTRMKMARKRGKREKREKRGRRGRSNKGRRSNRGMKNKGTTTTFLYLFVSVNESQSLVRGTIYPI